MNSPPDEVYEAVRDTDPECLDAEELDAQLRQLSQLEAWCHARKIRITRRQRQLASEGRATDPRNSLASHGRQSSRDARAASERETICTAMPAFEEALAGGDVAAGHVDAIATATRNLSDEELAEFVAEADALVADAVRQGVDTFGRHCRDMARSIRARSNDRSDVDELERQRERSKITRWTDQQTGMHKTLIECDPVTDRTIWAAVQRERGKLRQRSRSTGGRTRSWDRLTVDALVEAVADRASPIGSGRAALVVHVDVATLTGGRHDTTQCEVDSGVAIPIETARRMACEADIIPVVLGGDGVVLDEGRAKRLATYEQRLAIEAMQSTCSHPECTVTIDDCRIHHLTPWSDGGRTDLTDLAPVCETHHHLVHEGRWSLTMTPERVASWVRPDGETYWTGSLNDRRVIVGV